MLNNQEKLEIIKNEIKNLNPLADVLCTNFSKIPIEYFLEESKNSPFTNINDNTILEKNEDESCSGCINNHIYDDNNGIKCTHLNLIENIIIKTNIENLEYLDKKIGKILWDLSEEYDFKVIRFKGIMKIKNEENINTFMSLQGLYDLYEFTEINLNENNNLYKQSEKGNFYSKILFIGKNLKKNIKLFEDALTLIE